MSDLGNKSVMAENIKRYMEINDKSRSDICNDLGIKYTTFTDWIKGNTYPRIDKIELMANYFGIKKSDLVERQGITIEQAAEIKAEAQRDAKHMILYRSLSDADRKIIDDMMKALSNKG